MPPRILIFVGLSGDGPRAAAGAACELTPTGAARPLTLDAAHSGSVVRRTADRLAESLDLRPVAWELAVLTEITALLRERPDATVVIDAPHPSALLRILEAADLARARLDAGRPAEGTSTLAAQRSAEHGELALLRAAATAGDLLRAPELTTAGLLSTDDLVPAVARDGVLSARTALAFAGVNVLTDLLPSGASDAALAVAGGTAPAVDPAPVWEATPLGADLRLALPDLPDDLRAVRSGQELALHAAGLSRRVRAPKSLGDLVPGAVAAGADGTIVASFSAPGGAA